MKDLTRRREGVVFPSNKATAEEIKSEENALLQDAELKKVNGGFDPRGDTNPPTEGSKPYVS